MEINLRTMPQNRVAAVVKKVCDYFDINVEHIKSPSRHRTLVQARMFSYKILRDKGLSTEEIGQALGRDHSTVVYGLRKLEYELSTDYNMFKDWCSLNNLQIPESDEQYNNKQTIKSLKAELNAVKIILKEAVRFAVPPSVKRKAKIFLQQKEIV